MAVIAASQLRTPAAFESAKLVVKDFDGTVARTFEKSPEGIGVIESHVMAIDEMFGAKAVDTFIKNGGLRNRSALEVVQEAEPGVSGTALAELVARFIDTKLGISLEQIGTRFPDGNVWPRPTPGYLEHRAAVEGARQQGVMIDDAILSSGHEPFIKKTYAAWGVGLPLHIVAEDTVRGMALQFPPEQLIKPSPKLMEVVVNKWRESFQLADVPYLTPSDTRQVVYIGDDLNKDGELASNSHADFVHLRPGQEVEAWNKAGKWLGIGELMVRGMLHE